MSELEQLFSDDQTDLQSLDADASLDNWETARSTGDPLIDRWESQLARGETPDLDEEVA